MVRIGRPKVEHKKVTKSFRVDPRLWELGQTYAMISGKRMTTVINDALVRYLKNPKLPS